MRKTAHGLVMTLIVVGSLPACASSGGVAVLDDAPPIIYTRECRLWSNSDCIYAMEPDGSGIVELLRCPGTSYCFDPAWAPDGVRLSYSVFIDPNQSDIYIAAIDGTGPTNITNSQSSESGSCHGRIIRPF